VKRTFVLVALLTSIAHSAAAETRTKMFPLTSSGMPKSMKGAPGELSRVLARAFGAELTPMPIDDAASLLGCSLAATSCLEEIAKSAGVPKIVFGHVEPNDDGDLVIKLNAYESGKGESNKKLTVHGDTIDDVTQSLRDTLDNKPKKPEPPPPIETPLPVTPIGESGGVTRGTWGMIIGGLVVAGSGAAVYASSRSLENQVDKFEPSERADFDRLLALETAGKQRVQVGGALMVVGGLVATAGVVRAIVQKSSKRETPMLDVQPEKGGMSVVLTLGWR
jgi:hypothetical protein